MKLSLGISPCPNDTFMFDALIHQKIDTEGLEFDVYMDDVEALNKKSFENKLDVSKLSFHAISFLKDQYKILNSGSALGTNCGPILICKDRSLWNSKSRIAIPGKYTTANMLFKIAYPEFTNTEELLFSDIESAILNEQFDAGLIIHENRFTYKEKGLLKIKDLGNFWSEKTNLPIPLGAIVIKKTFDLEVQQKVDRVIRRSILFAFENRDSSLEFVKKHAQEMSIDVINSHIDLYVNNYSINIGSDGKTAVSKLYDFCGIDSSNIFVL